MGSVIREHILASTAHSTGAEVDSSARTDLLAAGGLTPKLYGLVTTKAPSSCFGNLLGSTELYRGPGLELAPLAGIFASSVPPDFRSLPRRAAKKAFTLQPGKTTLDPASKGTAVECKDLHGRPAVVAVAPGAPSAPLRLTVKLGGSGNTGSEKKKEKKEKKEKKGKKRKREKA